VCIEQGLSSIYNLCDVTDYNFILNPISKKCALSKGFHQFIASVMLQIIISFLNPISKKCALSESFHQFIASVMLQIIISF